MQEHVQLDQKQINADLLSGVLRMPKWWLALVGFTGLVFITGVGAFGWMINQGVGVTGLSRPIFWGFFMTNFVFWIGISHAGIMISAILRLTQAEWRRPITRAGRGHDRLLPNGRRSWPLPWSTWAARGAPTGCSPSISHGASGPTYALPSSGTRPPWAPT